MIISNKPICEILPKLKEKFRREGYLWLMVLVATELDMENAYNQLERYWSSFNSKTGKTIQFIFAGRNQNYHRELACNHDYYMETSLDLAVMPSESSMSTKEVEYYIEERRPKSSEWKDDHTDAIGSLKEYFHLSENQLPCLILFSSEKDEHTEKIIIPLTENTNLYKTVKTILEQIENYYKNHGEHYKKPEQFYEVSRSSPIGRLIRAEEELLNYAHDRKKEYIPKLIDEIFNHEKPALYLKNTYDHKTIGFINQYHDLLNAYPDLIKQKNDYLEKKTNYPIELKKYKKFVEDVFLDMKKIPLVTNDSYQCINKNSFDALTYTLRKIMLQILREPKYRGENEDCLNRKVRDGLENASYIVHDQTQQGTSESGKSIGEIDILINNTNDLPIAIYEGLRLKSLEKDNFSKHINKAIHPHKYNSSGCKMIFITVYAEAVEFQKLWANACTFLKAYDYSMEISQKFQENEHEYSELREADTILISNGDNIYVHYFFINMYHQ